MKKLVIVTMFLVLALSPAALQAQLDVGAQASWAEDVDFGVGARGSLRLPVASVPLEATAAFDVFFPSIDGISYYEFNANVAYLIQVPNSPVQPYVGGGLNFAIISADEITETILGQPIVIGGGSSTEVGLNILGGARFNMSPKLAPYGELRFEAGGGEQFVVTAGLLVNVGPGFAPKK